MHNCSVQPSFQSTTWEPPLHRTLRQNELWHFPRRNFEFRAGPGLNPRNEADGLFSGDGIPIQITFRVAPIHLSLVRTSVFLRGPITGSDFQLLHESKPTALL
jgi:hypothetical protein